MIAMTHDHHPLDALLFESPAALLPKRRQVARLGAPDEALREVAVVAVRT